MKYLFVESDNDPDYGKLTFQENFNGNLRELWQKVWDSPDHKMGFVLECQEDADDIYEVQYLLKADNLDEHTVNLLQELIDYDVNKAYGWVKAE